jgi:hypothetical protein
LGGGKYDTASLLFSQWKQKMNLSQFVERLQALVETGHGDLPVLYRHGASGECGSLSSPHVTDDRDDMGPFDLNSKEYVSIYAGD